MTTDYPRGYRPSDRQRAFNAWIFRLYIRAEREGLDMEIDGDRVELWDGDMIVAQYDFEASIDHPARVRM